MRPVYSFFLIILLVPALLVAQDPAAIVMRTTDWPASATVEEGVGWSVFSKQYYCVSNWNASGLVVRYSAGMAQTAALICRDGIPGFSWYHLYLSHFSRFKKISGILQLRFSLIDLKNRPPGFRLGGNIRTNWSVSQTLKLQVSVYDFTGWILPETAVARGDPAMQFLLFHEPGRMIGLVSGFRLNQSQFGPITAGIRVNFSDQIGLTGLFDVLPFGISFGINYQLKDYVLKGWLEQRNGMGVTPMMEVEGR